MIQKRNKTISSSILKTRNNKYIKSRNVEQDKINKMNILYNLLNNKKSNYELPNEKIENYFMKHSKRKLPRINPKIGSNIHGIFGDFQKRYHR